MRQLCGVELVLGSRQDPYGTSCDQPVHGSSTPHQADDPYGANGRVRWFGGGSCAGDRLPVRRIEWNWGGGWQA